MKSKHEFLVGFEGDYQVVYSNNVKQSITRPKGSLNYVDKMTLSQAKRKIRDLYPAMGGAVIFKLVPFKKYDLQAMKKFKHKK